MTLLPSGFDRARANVPSWRAVSGRLCMGAFVLAMLPAASAAQDAASVVAKMEANYRDVKSFDGAFQIHTDGKAQDGRAYNVTISEQVRFQSPNKFYIAVNASGSGPGITSPSGQQLIVSDGKNLYVYASQLKGYHKQVAPPAVPFLALLAQGGVRLPNGPIPGASVSGSKTVGGHPAIVLKVMRDASKLPANLPAAQKALFLAPVMISVDKSNYQLLSIETATPGGHTALTSERQKINPSLGSSSFVFTPPAGAKELPNPPRSAAPGGMAPPR